MNHLNLNYNQAARNIIKLVAIKYIIKTSNKGVRLIFNITFFVCHTNIKK